MAGLIGETHGKWLTVKFLWVDEPRDSTKNMGIKKCLRRKNTLFPGTVFIL